MQRTNFPRKFTQIYTSSVILSLASGYEAIGGSAFVTVVNMDTIRNYREKIENWHRHA